MTLGKTLHFVGKPLRLVGKTLRFVGKTLHPKTEILNADKDFECFR